MPRKDSPKRKEPEATRPTVPGYKFSAKKTGLLPWKWASDRLKKSRQYCDHAPQWCSPSDGHLGRMVRGQLLVQYGRYFTQGA